MDLLLEKVNKLQEISSKIGSNSVKINEILELPQIAVIGSQSSGKSSVLENIVGRDFLPRGKDIVTRRPLVLQLKNVPLDDVNGRQVNGAKMDSDWAEFEHCKQRVFTDFALVRKEIEDETNRETNNNKSVSAKPILLKIFSHKVVDLTLVDLPGITKVPREDQPADIEQQIRDMIHGYIEKESTIILAVHPANTDIATSEALKVAKDYDPEGRRTLAVVTKLDLMDRGTDANDMLSGKDIKVKLGLIGVVNRSQADIEKNKAITDAQNYERTFLMKNYPRIANQNGTAFLARSLSKLLLKHISERLPRLKSEVAGLVREYQSALMVSKPVVDKETTMAKILNDIVQAYKTEAGGSMDKIDRKRFAIGTRIRRLFAVSFENDMADYSIDNVPKQELLTAVRNSWGARESVFLPEAVFVTIAHDQIELLEDPCQRLANAVYDEMKMVINVIDEKKQLDAFPNLAAAVIDVINSVIEDRLRDTQAFLSTLIENEAAYINTRHPQFQAAQADLHNAELTDTEVMYFDKLAAAPEMIRHVNGAADPKSAEALENDSVWNPTTKEERDVVITQRYLRCYYDITKAGIVDKAPKAIFNLLVKKTSDSLRDELFKQLYTSEQFDHLLEEDENSVQERADMENTLEVLQEANSILNELDVAGM